MTTQLAFHKTTFTPICHNNRIWLTATEVGLAMEYADDNAAKRIYSRHSDEFTDMMIGGVKVTTLVECRRLEYLAFGETNGSSCSHELLWPKSSPAGF